LICALEALRDGLTGQLEWNYFDGPNSDRGGLWLRGDGTAVYSSIQREDFCIDEVGEIATGELEDPEVFADCMSAEFIEESFDCVRDALATKTTICQERVTDCEKTP
jgi:hypothetical protein